MAQDKFNLTFLGGARGYPTQAQTTIKYGGNNHML
jgi:hypothetical protein